MAVTVTLDETQLERIRGLVAAGSAPNVSAFVQHAVSDSERAITLDCPEPSDDLDVPKERNKHHSADGAGGQARGPRSALPAR